MRNTTELIERIVKLLDENFLVFVKRDNGKLVAVPEFEDYSDFMDFDDDNYELLYDEIETNPDAYFQIKKLTSRELYNTMMDFALDQERVDSVVMVKALRTNHPFEEFKKVTSKMGSVMFNGWTNYYRDQLKRIIRTRLCREHIHFQSEKCN